MMPGVINFSESGPIYILPALSVSRHSLSLLLILFILNLIELPFISYLSPVGHFVSPGWKSISTEKSRCHINIRTMPKSSADEKILSYNDVVLRQSDLGILNGPHDLNDRIIEFYFSYLSTSHPSEHILLVPPSIAFWTMSCPDIDSLKDFLQPLNLPSKKLIIFPINDNDDVTVAEGGSHWSLLVFEKTANLFVHHDSLGGLNKNHAKHLYKTLVRFMGDSETHYMECDSTPQQVNGYDCGLYVLAIAKEICCWFDSNAHRNEDLWFSCVKERVTPSTVSRMRVEILELIKNLRETK